MEYNDTEYLYNKALSLANQEEYLLAWDFIKMAVDLGRNDKETLRLKEEIYREMHWYTSSKYLNLMKKD